MQAEEQHGEGVALRFVEHGEEIGATHEQEGSDVVQRVEEVDWRHHQTPQDHHQSSEVLVHSLEQPVQSQGEEDSHGPVSRSPTIPRRKSNSCAAMLLAVAVAFPCTNSLLGI